MKLGVPGGSAVKSLPAMQKTQEAQAPSPGREDPLEEGMAPTPGLLPGDSREWRNLVGCSPQGRRESDATE